MAEAIRIFGIEHVVGDMNCSGCDKSAQKCKCGGVVHAAWTDDDNDNPVLVRRCDECWDDCIQEPSYA